MIPVNLNGSNDLIKMAAVMPRRKNNFVSIPLNNSVQRLVTEWGGKQRQSERWGVSAMSAGSELKKLRLQRGITIREVVKQSNGMLDKTTVSRIERDDRGISFRSAYCFSRIYNIEMEALFELLQGKKVPPSRIPFDTSAQEREMLKMYRALSHTRRRTISEIVKAMALLGDFPTTEEGRRQLLKELRTSKEKK